MLMKPNCNAHNGILLNSVNLSIMHLNTFKGAALWSVL
jgi:hypothetical protein